MLPRRRRLRRRRLWRPRRSESVIRRRRCRRRAAPVARARVVGIRRRNSVNARVKILVRRVCERILYFAIFHAGSASPQNVRKLMSLSEQSKIRPRSRPAPAGLMRPPAPLNPSHERSYSDTTGSHADFYSPALLSVDLSAESSSVTSLSKLPSRKNITTSEYSQGLARCGRNV